MKYYFLVSFLPEIHRDDQRLKLRLADLLSEKYLFSDKDWADIEWILLAGDVLQIERLWSGKEVTVEYSLYGRDFWKEQIRTVKDVPDFFEDSLSTFLTDGISPKVVDQLYKAYYTHAMQQTTSLFLRNYLAFERDVRNIVTAIRARQKGLSPSEHVLGEGDLVDLLSRSMGEDFGLTAEYPWIETLTASQYPLQTEEVVQRILWETIDDMVAPMHFEFDVVLAYLLKLHMLERNLALSDDGGKEIVRQLEEL